MHDSLLGAGSVRPMAFSSLRFPVALTGCLVVGGVLSAVASAQQGVDGIGDPGSARSEQTLDAGFVANYGQWPSWVRFASTGGGLQVAVTDGGFVMHAARDTADGHGTEGVALHFRFQDRERDAAPEEVGDTRQSGLRNYLLGARRVTGVPSYGRVRTSSLYPGTNLLFRKASGVVEYDLELSPGASLAQVHVVCEGHDSLAVTEDGQLAMETPLGTLFQTAPVTYVELEDGSRQLVDCQFELRGTNAFGFTAPDWDGSQALLLDPGLVWGAPLGGAAMDRVEAIELDASGQVYAAGTTASMDFPSTPGAYRTNSGGSDDAFVANLSNDGTTLNWATYYGGSGAEQLGHLDRTVDGTLWICGTTTSANLPVAQPYSGSRSGPSDAFVARLSANGASLLMGTYFGGPGDETSMKMDVDGPGGLVHLAGITGSTVPTTAGGYQTTRIGGQDLFLATLRVTAATTTLSYGSYYGGPGNELSVDNVYVDANGIVTMGVTSSSTGMFTTPTAFQSSFPGGQRSGAIVCLQPSLFGAASLIYATYLGGNRDDSTVLVALDGMGFFQLCMNTSSTNWPTPNGLYPTNPGGSQSMLVMDLNAGVAGAAGVRYASYFGGTGVDAVRGFDFDPNGTLTFCGETTSPDLPLSTNAMDDTLNGFGGFVTQFNRNFGTAAVRYSSFLHGCFASSHEPICVRRQGSIITIGGGSDGQLVPVQSNAFQTVPSGGGDGFITRIDGIPPPRVTTFGTGCGAPGFVPLLTPVNEALICSNFRVEITGMRPAALGAMIFGFSRTNWNGLMLPRSLSAMNMPGCTQYTSIEATTILFANGQGNATYNFGIPAFPDIAGIIFHLQHLVFDPSANRRGIALSNAAEVPLRW